MPVNMKQVEEQIKGIGKTIKEQREMQALLNEFSEKKDEIIRANEIQIRLLEEALGEAIEQIRSSYSDRLNYVDEKGNEITDTQIWEALLKMDTILPIDETLMLMQRVDWLWRNNFSNLKLIAATGTLYLVEMETGRAIHRFDGIKCAGGETDIEEINGETYIRMTDNE